MKLILSDGAYDELKRRAANRDLFHTGNPLHLISGIMPGYQVQTSIVFPYRQQCRICDGTGDGGECSTYCQPCGGGGGHIVEGLEQDRHGMVAKLFTRRLPLRFAVSFPNNVSVPAAPPRGRIKEVRL